MRHGSGAPPEPRRRGPRLTGSRSSRRGAGLTRSRTPRRGGRGIDFDAAGNLYLSTGDDTNPFASDGFTPIDDRASRTPVYDAQRSSGNTNDLRGKILRIKVNADGSYSIPSGNLFPSGTARTRPEIYAIGFRNPFRMSVDKATGIVYMGDYGPDSGTASSTRGQVEFNRITKAGKLRLAVLHRQERRLRRLRDRRLGIAVQLRGTEEHFAAQHRPHRPARRRARLDALRRRL